jgi:hypothetical protein
VADLLECLIQIKGVADTPRRLSRRVADVIDGTSSPDAAGRLAHHAAARMVAAELWFSDCLSLMLASERPRLPAWPSHDVVPDEPAALAERQAEFAARRAATVRALEGCSADQLNRIGIEPSRGPMTVADLVALMLAHDTDTLGALITLAASGHRRSSR